MSNRRGQTFFVCQRDEGMSESFVAIWMRDLNDNSDTSNVKRLTGETSVLAMSMSPSRMSIIVPKLLKCEMQPDFLMDPCAEA